MCAPEGQDDVRVADESLAPGQGVGSAMAELPPPPLMLLSVFRIISIFTVQPAASGT